MPRAKRRLGQHFLSDPRILARIAEAVGAGPHDTVLEIGPGLGGLTGELAARAGKVITIEKDHDLIASLRAKYPAVKVIEADALEIDWHQLLPASFLVAGNIPYNITSPLLDKALLPPRPKQIVFLVQKEVADRVTARPATREYGALTIGVQTVATAERLFVVPAGAFQPRPQVDSAVLRIVPVENPPITDAERLSFRQLVVGLFGLRRKQMLRALRELTGWKAERAAQELETAGIDSTVRAEVLSPEEFVRLHRILVDGGWRARVAL
jgi:16S rRNA (adenine1518-N6/adenine1519-N6)-dimethyltransferase